MATLRLSNTFLTTSLSGLYAPSIYATVQTGFIDDMTALFMSGAFNEEPTFNSKGTTATFKNPTFSGGVGLYSLTGSASITFDGETGDIMGSTANFTKAEVNTGAGTLAIAGSFTSSISDSANKYSESASSSITSISYAGDDGSAWLLKGSLSEAYSYTYTYASEAESGSYKITVKITEFSSSDSIGNRAVFKGSYTYDARADIFKGTMTSLSLTIDGASFTATKLAITYDDFINYTFPSMSDVIDIILAGNDTLTIAESDVPESGVFGFGGNDQITGTSGNDAIYGDYSVEDDRYFSNILAGKDTLSGGNGDDYLDGGYGDDSLSGGDGADYIYGAVGADKMNGGSGNDELVAYGSKDVMAGGSGSDLFTLYCDGPAMNATISDFSLSDGDILDVYVFTSESEFVYDHMDASNFVSGSKLTSSNSADALFVYDTSTGKLYYDADANGQGKGVVIATLTGKPAVAADSFGADTFAPA